MNFSNVPQFGIMVEAQVTNQVYKWMDNIAADINDDYWFTVTYIFNQNGVAVTANIFVQRKHEGKWYDCGVYNCYQLVPFADIKCKCLDLKPTPAEQKQSQPIHCYVDDCYVNGCYV